MKTIDDVVGALTSLAKLYDRQLEARTIVFYSDVILGKLTPDEACQAVSKWAERETKFPPPVGLIEIIKPKIQTIDAATELSMRLSNLIARRGYTWDSTCRYDGYANVNDAVVGEAGHDAAEVVRRCGGWVAFCKEWGGESGNTAARAQLRGVCQAIASGAGAQSDRARLTAPNRNNMYLEEFDHVDLDDAPAEYDHNNPPETDGV